MLERGNMLTYSDIFRVSPTYWLIWHILTVGNKQDRGSPSCGWIYLLVTRSRMFIERTDRVENSISSHHQNQNQDKTFSVSSSTTTPVHAKFQTSLWPLPPVLVQRVSTSSVSWVPSSALPEFELPPAYTCQYLFTSCCIRDVGNLPDSVASDTGVRRASCGCIRILLP